MNLPIAQHCGLAYYWSSLWAVLPAEPNFKSAKLLNRSRWYTDKASKLG